MLGLRLGLGLRRKKHVNDFIQVLFRRVCFVVSILVLPCLSCGYNFREVDTFMIFLVLDTRQHKPKDEIFLVLDTRQHEPNDERKHMTKTPKTRQPQDNHKTITRET
jgi:hypothetical protein